MAVSNCSIIGQNTGGVDCDFERGNPQVIIAGSAAFTPSETVDSTTFEAAFTSKIKQSTGVADKLFPFPVITGVTDKTEAAKYGSSGYGLQIKLLRSKAGYEFDVLAGTALEKRLMAFDGKQIPLFILDDNVGYNVWGVQDASGNFSGAIYQVGVEPRGHGDAQNPKFTKITISILNSRDFVENAAIAPSSFAAGDLKGLNDVTPKEAAAHASNVYYLKLYVPTAQIGNGLDITPSYGADISDVTLWSSKSGTTFSTSLPITSLTYDAALQRLVFTFDTTAFGLLSAGAKFKLSADDVPTLDAADVAGIEVAPIILTK